MDLDVDPLAAIAERALERVERDPALLRARQPGRGVGEPAPRERDQQVVCDRLAPDPTLVIRYTDDDPDAAEGEPSRALRSARLWGHANL